MNAEAVSVRARPEPAFTGRIAGWQQLVWHAALGCFLLAAATGVLLRFGFLLGLPYGLQLGDVRHAHSHLMFFGWVTPVLMLLLLRFQGPVSRAGRAVLCLALFSALASFVPFLLSGYRLTPVFGRELPLSMVTSGLNGVAWFAFIALYLLRACQRKRTLAGSFFLAALVMLLLSSLGAAALGAAGMMKAGPALVAGLATYFLDLFAEGWFGLALLGLAYTLWRVPERNRTGRLGLAFLTAGLTVRSLAALSVASGATPLEPFALVGSAFAGLGLLAALLPLARKLQYERLSLWHLALGFLALKGVIDLLLSNPSFAAWSDGAGLRVFYLHAYLLGTISLGLVAAIRDYWGKAAFRLPWLLAGSVLLMTASLLPLSGVWPAAWAGRWVLVAAAWLSPLPLIAVLISVVWRQRVSSTPTDPSDRRGSRQQAHAQATPGGRGSRAAHPRPDS